jgi:hypothetical protein
MKRAIRSGMFVAAVVAALGFGGAQAFASPGAAKAERACDPAQCDANCKARGFTGGYCQFGWCGCYVDLPPAG